MHYYQIRSKVFVLLTINFQLKKVDEDQCWRLMSHNVFNIKNPLTFIMLFKCG